MQTGLHLPGSRGAFALLLALLASSWLAAFGFTVWRLHQDALANGMSKAVAQARSFEDQLTQALKVIDITANTLEPQIKPRGRVDAIEHGRSLNAALRLTPYLRSLSLLDSSGRIVASSNPQNLGTRIDTAGFFPTTRPDADVLRIGIPWRGRDFSSAAPAVDPSGKATDLGFVPVVRKLSSGDQALWLLVALNPDYFINYVAQLLDSADDQVQWLRYDSRLLFSTTVADSADSTSASGVTPELLATRETGQLANQSFNGRQVLTAYRTSSQFPVVVVMHIDREHVLAEWRAESLSQALIVLPVLLALGIVSVLMWRRQQRIMLQQHELERERGRAASVFDASSDAIILTKPDGEILSVNPAFEKLNGYSAAEATGRNPRMLQSGKQDAGYYSTMWENLRQVGHWQNEITNRRKDGSVYDGLLTINAVKDASGQLLHYVGVTTDISARKREEAQLAQHAATLALAKEAAESANRAKTAFLATISHELRTPMNGIMGMTTLAMRRVSDPKALAQLEKASQSASSLLVLLNDLIEISSIEANRLQLDDVPFTLDPVPANLQLLLHNKASAKGLAFSIELSEGLGKIRLRGDPKRLENIINNLAVNSIKFTTAGFVAVRILATTETPTHVDLRVEVADSGIGLDPSDQSRVFYLFEQGDGSMTRKYGGTGLGLALCKRLVESMGGKIGVSSELGVGSTFWFVVRLRKDDGTFISALDAAV